MGNIKDWTLFEDQNILLLNKPIGVAVQSASTSQISIENLLIESLGEYHIITRIDQVVSGIVIVAKNKDSASLLTKKLKRDQIIKQYVALVEGHPVSASKSLQNNLVKQGNKAYVKSPGKKAILIYKTKKQLDRYTFLNIQLKTGRFHQIRCQLGHMGHPIKGDVKYGARRSNKEKGIYLHCESITITNYPDEGNHLSIKAPFPSMKLWDLQ